MIEINELEASLELCRQNSKRRGISLRSYIQANIIDKGYKTKLLNLCQDEIEPTTHIICLNKEVYREEFSW